MSSQRLERTYKGQGEVPQDFLLAGTAFQFKTSSSIKGLWFQLLLRSRSGGARIAGRQLLPPATPKHLTGVIFIGTLVYNDSNWLVLQYERKQVSLLLVSTNACSCSSASAWLIQCTIICLQFSRASGEYSFHHLPIFPAWNRRLPTTLLAPMLLAATRLGQTRHCFRNLTRLCLMSVLIFD